MNLEPIKLSRRKAFANWLSERLTGMYARDTRLWRFTVASVWVLSCMAAAITALGMPTGFGTTFDVLSGIALNTVVMAISAAAVMVILSLFRMRIPRYTTGSLIYMNVLLFCILYFCEFGWKAALVFSVASTLLALGLGLLVGGLMNLRLKQRIILAGLTAAIGFVAINVTTGFPYRLLGMSVGHADMDRSDSGLIQQAEFRTPLQYDPTHPGEYSYQTFTYGSGGDRHRSEYGEAVSERSRTVDASTYIPKWPWLREQFWGFDETELPLNGRVWMPEGEGPFPIVFMVHGNHLMEKFSDGGYGYLGELLASRGVIAISVDENFLNYSVWSGIPKQDMKLRAWVMLKHIQQIQSFSKQTESAFYGRVDFGRIALLGHSRGGQAAAMAAAREQWFAKDQSLPATDSYKIQAVIALAPTDTSVDGQRTELKDVSYLTLQGAKDADLVNFYGDRQYGRVEFPNDPKAFKASLYIEDANHSQFNTEWGRSDNSMPVGLFVRPTDLLEPEQQRQVAKVYVSAFLDVVFHDVRQMEALFRDYRSGLNLLPATRYYNQYESGSFRKIADFAEGNRSVLAKGLKAEAKEMAAWSHVDALNRQGEAKEDKGVELAWKDESSYTVELSPFAIDGIEGDDTLMFSIANMMRDLEAMEAEELFGEELVSSVRLGDKVESSLSIDVEVADRSGNAVRLPLNQFMETEPQVETEFTWLPGMESVISSGKYKDIEEPVYQTYELPLEAFIEANDGFEPSEWTRMTFYFNEGPGKVMIDNLGWMEE